MTISENTKFQNTGLTADQQLRKSTKRELEFLVSEGYVVFSHHADDNTVYVTYKATYLSNDPDNGWDRRTAERFTVILETLGWLGYKNDADATRLWGCPGEELATFTMSN